MCANRIFTFLRWRDYSKTPVLSVDESASALTTLLLRRHDVAIRAHRIDSRQ